jgi:hypothetical protein
MLHVHLTEELTQKQLTKLQRQILEANRCITTDREYFVESEEDQNLKASIMGAHRCLMDAYYLKRDFRQSLKHALILCRINPDNPALLYDLGCLYVLADNLRGATCTLKEAIKCGFNNATWMMADPDLARLREDKRYGKLHKELLELFANSGSDETSFAA